MIVQQPAIDHAWRAVQLVADREVRGVLRIGLTGEDPQDISKMRFDAAAFPGCGLAPDHKRIVVGRLKDRQGAAVVHVKGAFGCRVVSSGGKEAHDVQMEVTSIRSIIRGVAHRFLGEKIDPDEALNAALGFAAV